MALGDHADATLEIRRTRMLWRDRFAKYAVELDGKAVGSIKNGLNVRLTIAPGPHRVQLRSGSGRRHNGSKTLNFEARPSEIVTFITRPSGYALTSALDGILAMLGKKPWVVLERADDRPPRA